MEEKLDLELIRGTDRYKRILPVLKARYIMASPDDFSIRKLEAEFSEYGMKKSTIHKYATELGWDIARITYQEAIEKKVMNKQQSKLEVIKEKIFDRDEGVMDKLITVSNTLLDKLTTKIDKAGKDENPELDYEVISRDLNRLLNTYDKIRTSYAKMRKIMTDSAKSGNVTINLNTPIEYLNEDGVAWLKKQVENPSFVSNNIEEAEYEEIVEEVESSNKTVVDEGFDPTLGLG